MAVLHQRYRRRSLSSRGWFGVICALVVMGFLLAHPWLSLALGIVAALVLVGSAMSAVSKRPRAKSLYALGPKRFARRVGQLLGARGWSDVRWLGDVDLLATAPDGVRTLVHCNHTDPHLSADYESVEVALKRQERCKQYASAVVTTGSGFAKSARLLADREGVELLTGTELVRPLRREQR